MEYLDQQRKYQQAMLDHQAGAAVILYGLLVSSEVKSQYHKRSKQNKSNSRYMS